MLNLVLNWSSINTFFILAISLQLKMRIRQCCLKTFRCFFSLSFLILFKDMSLNPSLNTFLSQELMKQLWPHLTNGPTLKKEKNLQELFLKKKELSRGKICHQMIRWSQNSSMLEESLAGRHAGTQTDLPETRLSVAQIQSLIKC